MIETKRLLHRKMAPDDLDIIFALRSDADVARFIGGEAARTREFNEQRLQYYLECHERLGFGMCLMSWKETGRVIGWSGLQPLRETGEIEVGYGMIREFWGRGIGSETARAWLKYGFNTAGLERIVAVADPANRASWRIMEKLGMKFEKKDIFYNSECVYYAISKSEFARIQANVTGGGKKF